MRFSISWRLVALASFLCAFAGVARATEIPVNLGFGPAAFYIPERLDNEDPKPFYGLRIHVKAIIDKEMIKKHKSEVPPNLRAAVEKVDEIEVGYLLIPESIMLGSRTSPHGPEVYGSTWRPIGVSLPIKMGPTRLALGTGLLFTYAYINTGDYKIIDQSDDELKKIRSAEEIRYRRQVTHFFRPGADLNLDYEIRFSDQFLVNLGWSSAYYVPQEIGGAFFSLGADDLQKSIWRIHQAYLLLNYRIPVSGSF